MASNTEKKNEYCRDYHWCNREKILERKRKYNAENKDKIKQYYLDNKVAINTKTKKWSDANRDKCNASNRKYCAKNPNKKRDERLQRDFGITLENYQQMLAEQNGVCALCFQPEKRIISKNGKISELAVDHCHATGKIRGLLCAQCNTGLGLFYDNTEVLTRAISYLTQYKGNNMSETTKKKSKSWPRIGSLRRGENGSYIKLEANVTILVDGQPIEMNEARVVRLDDPRASVERMRDAGHIDEKTADQRLEKLASIPWLKYDLIVAPPMKKA